MENRKSKSHSNLLVQGPSSTDLLPHTQSLHCTLYNAGTGISPASFPSIIPSRPGSSRPNQLSHVSKNSRPFSSRPFSSRPMSSRPMSSRPVSRMEQSRSPSRIDSSRSPSRINQHKPTEIVKRPVSAIRPLSGRVFMRRMEHGWVAKHYPENDPSSQTNLFNDDGDLEDLSDCESLDSFFNEEFDDREDGEKLKSLLSCNTLGVESKGHKRDWNSGEVGIPKFHCPRCRDHWYGITPFPCDEELARLIREGLWYTGNKDTTGKTHHAGKESGTMRTIENTTSDSPTSRSRTSNMKTSQVMNEKDSRGHDLWEMSRKENQKNKRRITFNLDHQNDDEREDLKLRDKDSYNTEAKESHNELPKDTENKGAMIEHQLDSRNGMNNATQESSRMSLNHSNTSTLNTSLNPTNNDFESSGSKNSLTRKQGRRGRGKGKRGSSSNMLTSREGSKDDLNIKKKRETTGLNTKLIAGVDDVGMSLANALADDDNEGLLSTKNSQRNNHGNSSNKSTSDMGKKLSDMQSTLHDSSHDSTHDDKTNISEKGGGPDYGRKVRKPGGYMRASSPTGSEWGDPSHARPYASSIATSSHTGSTYNLLKDKQSAAHSLPPLIKPIPQKHRVDFSEGGFEITPPWRFSYFSPSPIHTGRVTPQSTTRASSNSLRRRK